MVRRKILPFLLANILAVGFLVHSFWPLICLLVQDGRADRISRAELPAPNSESIADIALVVPKIIHQTFITCDTPGLLNGTCSTAAIPEMWGEAHTSCQTLHKDYEYKLWSDLNSRDFIQHEYPWFLSTWDSYAYPIQRADAIRYFALEHYGGVYIDLDDGCQRRLDPLLSYPMWVRRSHPTGIGNDVIGAVPHHPFIRRVIDSLPHYNHRWFSPYITIMSSTGPLFFSLVWHHYNADGPLRDGDRVRILFGDEYMGNTWSFFSHHMGNSWHMWDAKAIFWMGQHWLPLTLAGFAVAFGVIGGLWLAWSSGCRGVRRCRRDLLAWRCGPASHTLPTRESKDGRDFELVALSR